MERRVRPEILWVIVLSLLFLPILYVSLANMYQTRTPLLGSGRVHYAIRAGSFVFAALCAAAAVILERRFRNLPAEKRSGRIFICGLALFLAPGCLALFLFLLGNPKIDLYILAGVSFSGILGWSWLHGDLFHSVEDRSGETALKGDSRTKAPTADLPARPLNSYTVLLICVGFLSLAVTAARIALFSAGADRPSPLLGVRFPVMVYEIAMMLGCWITAFLRKSRSPYAPAATAVITAMLIPGFPVGTAIFFYWLAWVRRQVNRKANCRYF